MHAVPRLPEQESVPGDDSNNDPTPPLPAEPGRNAPESHPAGASGSGTRHPPKTHDKAEPDIDNERDIPSDGRDPEGEGMIRELDKPVEPSPEKKPTSKTAVNAHGH